MVPHGRGAHPFGPGRTESGGDGISAGHALSLAAHACRRSCRTLGAGYDHAGFCAGVLHQGKSGERERVGIMLPASAAAVLAWLGALMAGKTPVMCNWTSGAANFSHGLEAAGVRRVFTSSRLLDRLSGQGFPVGEHADVWVALEDAKRLSLPAKLGAFLKSRLLGIPCLGEAVIPRRVPETAAILFTSGSEALPKAVPLTHMNILANCRDIAAVLKITSHDSMLSMLPPFHSLGLTGNIALPLAFGLPAVYLREPHQGARLAALTRRWKPTITVAPHIP
ncbi:MAG: AMP-binding protein [Bilophila wadsworthia]